MEPTRRTFVQLVGLAGASATLGGCDRALEALADLAHPPPEADFRPPASDEIDAVAHALNRLTWGAAPGDYRRVADLGVDAFIEEQLDPASIDDGRCDWTCASIESLFEPAAELYEYTSDRLLFDLTRHKIIRHAASRRQLLEVMVDFWTDHFNIVSEKGDCRWLKVADDRDVIRAHALGDFRTLLRASALSPAMLIYLDGHDNKVERPGDRPNENYARELLELHTLGVHGGYEQRDVMEVARCLSGWTYENRPFAFRGARVEFVAGRHDDGAKRVLGVDIPAGGGAGDLERVLDIVVAHPSTARHLGEKLARRFVADPPPPDAVDTAARAFERTANIADTLRALFTTDAFRAARGTMFKRPLRFVVSSLRVTGAKSDAGRAVIGYLERMGHAPFQYPTPDGYPMDPTPWLGTLLWRWNFALALTEGGIGGTALDVDALVAKVGGPDALAAHVLGRVAHPAEHDVIAGASSPLALLLASPAFQHH